MKRYIILIPLSILFALFIAAWTGQTASNLPAQSATAVPTQTPAAVNSAPSSGVIPYIPNTGRSSGNPSSLLNLAPNRKPESSVGELPNAQPADMQPFIGAVQDLPENVQKAAAAHLVDMLNANPEKVLIVSAMKRDFNNACLGLAQEDEACAEAVTPGWLAIGTVNGSYYVVHASEDGSNIRIESPLNNAGLTNFGRDFPMLGETGE